MPTHTTMNPAMSELDTIQSLEATLFTPVIEQAIVQAKGLGHAKKDTVYALANAYLNALVLLVGDKKTAADFLQQQSDYLRTNH